ncbi:MAG: hypothetical protein NZ578_16635 [Candidatus Binatia bacterium]|nr:hypothetical protein [Candidatus Binatia bacterium]
MAAPKGAQGLEDFVTIYRSFFLDLPLAGVQWALGMTEEKEIAHAAWNGYDAAVRLSTTAVDTLYHTPLFGHVMAQSLDGLLRWQRFGNALADTFFATLWQTVGLPTAAQTQALRAEVEALREEVRALSPKREEKAKAPQTTRRRERRQADLNGNGLATTMRSAA